MKQNSVKRSGSRAVVAVALVLAFTACAGFTLESTGAAQGEAERVREALLRNASAFERGDMEALNKVWANDESVTVFEQGHANYGWADYRDNHLAPEVNEMKNTKYALSDIRVKVSGATAWATFKYALSADTKGRRIDGSGLGTAVLEKRRGHWQIVHWHTSALRRSPAAAPTPARS